MELINTETLVSSLLVFGFESVDPILYTYTLGKLTLDNKDLKLFEFIEAKTSNTFDENVDFDGTSFSIRDDEKSLELLKLHTNKKLMEYFEILDFSEILSKKIADIKECNLSNELLCPKEKKLIRRKKYKKVMENK